MGEAENHDAMSDQSDIFGLFFEDSFDLHYKSKGPTVTLTKEDVHQYFLAENLATELYDLLKCTHAIFEHFGITYWLTGGSMIGYMRHGGIIPWDDDIDICCFITDKEKIFSPEVLEAFKSNNIKVIEDQTYNMENPTLSKIYRSTAKSKAIKSGQVPYPFIDVFYMAPPNKYFNNAIRFFSRGNEDHWIAPEELYPIKKINFGPVTANAPFDPVPQLDRGYGKNWSKEGQIHTQDHVTKQGRGGPRQIFDVKPFLNVSAAYDLQKISSQVILPNTLR